MGRHLVYAVTLISIFLFSSFSHATEQDKDQNILHEMKIGLLAHDVDNLMSSSKREQGEDLNFEAVFSSLTRVLGGDIHPVLGASINTQGYTSKFYFDTIWRYYVTDSIYGAFGLGVAIHNGNKHLEEEDMKALGSQVLFHIPIEIGFNFYSQFSLSVYFDHISNAYICDENEGLDTLGVRFGYKF